MIPHEANDVKRCTRQIRTQDPMIRSPTLTPLDQRLQLPNRRKSFAIYVSVNSKPYHPRGKKGVQNPHPLAYKNELKPHPQGIFLNYSL